VEQGNEESDLKMSASENRVGASPAMRRPAAGDSRGGVVVIPNGGSSSSGLPSNKSNQKLVNEDYLDGAVSRSSQDSASSSSITKRASIVADGSSHKSKITKTQWLTVIILCYVNLINYMDRFTLAGKYFLLCC